MLSSTYTITDVKLKLRNDYAFFGYTTDALFVSALTSVASDVTLVYFYPRIGKTEYDRIKALNKAGLSETEEYLYWAEVYTICSEFLKGEVARTGQMQTSSNERLTVEGYTYQTGGSSSSSQGDYSLRYYRDKMFSFWKLAGHHLMSLERSCTIWGSSNIDETTVNIIE